MSTKTSVKSKRPVAAPKIGDDAVREKTGKNWDEWFAALDGAGAAGLDHKGIAKMLSEGFGVAPWWSQMVAVTYEQARGLRAAYQKSDGGFSASRSKTVGAPLAELFAAWNDPKRRRRWLDMPVEVRKATDGKSMRITWPDGTNVEAYFAAKGDSKSSVSVEHGKLADAEAVARSKAFWGEALDRMKATLE